MIHLPKTFRSSQGFSLVELLISVTIISILSVGVIPAFTGYIRNQNLRQAQEQLKSDLRSIQNRALTGSLSDQMIGSSKVQFWGIRFVQNSDTYQFFVAAVNTSCPSSYSQGQYQGNSKLDPKVTIQSASLSGSCMFFDIKNGDITTYGSGLNSPIIIGYGSTSAANSRRVHFNSSGLIYTQND